MLQPLRERRRPPAGSHPSALAVDVLRGLRQSPKSLPSKYFYDQHGSRLFDAICELEEYYPTRTELGIMQRWAPEIAASLPPDCVLIELGSGSSTKTELLLDALPALGTYVPIDISGEHLMTTAERLRQRYRRLEVRPVVADFTAQVSLPPLDADVPRVAYFPGSTIGNFEPAEAKRLLRNVARLIGPGGMLLVGIDLQKDPAVIEAAYNDRQGITAAFNLNLLRRINRELGSHIQVDLFTHQAVYDRSAGRIEMRLRSTVAQVVDIAGQQIEFDAGETIRTEYSHKHTLEGFAQLAGEAGFIPRAQWLDERRYFAVSLMEFADVGTRTTSDRPAGFGPPL